MIVCPVSGWGRGVNRLSSAPHFRFYFRPLSPCAVYQFRRAGA